MSARIKSYENAKAYLGNKQSRPYANNTRIMYDSLELGHDVITVLYHDNPIVNFYPDRMTLDSCGWKTSTTKERLNWFIPDGFYVYQERGQWYLANRNDNSSNVFADGITIMNNGNVYNAGSESDDTRVKELTKRIKKYVTGYIAELIAGNVPAPDNGDCWYCLMKTQDNTSLGDATGNTEHIESHLDESYYVPSLLYNAIESYPVCQMARYTIAQLWGIAGIGEGKPSNWELEIMTRDVKSSLTRYLKRQLGIAS